MSTDISVERATPEEVFALLGNETRMEILEALLETPNEPVRFADLRKRVGERDSGKFNYHLSKLVDNFVRKADDGYELSLAGKQVVGAILAGGYTTKVAFDPIPIDEPCRECGEPLEAEYRDERVRVQCSACGQVESMHTFPPGTIEQFTREELPFAFDRWLNVDFERILSGFWPTCSGRMTGSLVQPEDAEATVDVEFGHLLGQFECDRCGTTAHTHAVMPLLVHPAGVCFFYDNGLDPRETPSWELPRLADWRVESVADDLSSAHVVVSIDGEELSATIDGSLAVGDVDRRAA